MAASKKSDAPAIVAVPEDDIKELLAGGTVRETNTQYEDRTIHPLVEESVEYEVEKTELDGGTILETFMEPVGGFPEAE